MSKPLILASGSKARQEMLTRAGLKFKAIPADIDEKALLAALKNKLPPAEIAAALAQEKAKFVTAQNPGAYVVGADQILVFKGKIFSKAATKEEARASLQKLRGQTHHLISAVCVAKDGEILWDFADSAALAMRNFDDDFLDAYCAQAGEALTKTVGAYELEGRGASLFEKTEGDFFTILGLPLLPLLGFLLQEGVVP